MRTPTHSRSALDLAGGVGAAIARLWPFAAAVLGWWLWVTLGDVDEIVAPQPLGVARELATHPMRYLPDLGWTVGHSIAGLATGSLLGLCLAVSAWTSPVISGLVNPAALLVRTTPIVAFIPVLATVLGYSTVTVIAITTLVSFFPAYVLVSSGLRDRPAGATEVLGVLGGTRAQLLRFIALPSAMPNLLVSIRLSSSTCVLAALLAEYLMGTHGLGYRLALASGFLDTSEAWAVASIATALSIGAFLATARLEGWGRVRFHD